MDQKPISEIVRDVLAGQIRIPAFQRGFIWEPERVAQLMDSIYKKYPFGVLLFWRAKDKLKSERKLGPFKLPDPKEDYPLDYVLDGQQRITSIFATFQTALLLPQDDPTWNWKDIYFDVVAAENPQDAQFFALSESEVDPKRHFPLKVLFDPVKYRQATDIYASDESLLRVIDQMYSVFKEVQIPVHVFRTENKAMVSIIFERINRQGVPLDTLQLLCAWTWSEDFHLQQQFTELREELHAFGFDDPESDENLMLRCAAAILVGEPGPDALVDLNGARVRARFSEVVNGIKGALDFLRANLRVEKITNLPFQTVLVPLAVLFAIDGNQQMHLSDEARKKVCRWFWRVCFTKRYSSGVLRNLKADIEHVKEIKNGRDSQLGEFHYQIDDWFFVVNDFNLRNVNTKTFVLMLAQAEPLNFISSTSVDLAEKLKEYNRAEFHHLYPRAYLQSAHDRSFSENCLANFAFLASAENKALGGSAPSVYRSQMPTNCAEILRHAICPTSLFSDDFGTFIQDRAGALTFVARTLAATGRPDLRFIDGPRPVTM